MAAPTTYKVKNKSSISLRLQDAQGDEVQVPPGSTSPVDARFIDFQLPSLQIAEVIGYDYAARLKTPQSSQPVD